MKIHNGHQQKEKKGKKQQNKTKMIVGLNVDGEDLSWFRLAVRL